MRRPEEERQWPECSQIWSQKEGNNWTDLVEVVVAQVCAVDEVVEEAHREGLVKHTESEKTWRGRGVSQGRDEGRALRERETREGRGVAPGGRA